MSDAILVVNAGSSSIKYSMFLQSGSDLEPYLRGQLEGLYTEPRFEAKDAAGEQVAQFRWPAGDALGHDGAIAYLAKFLRERREGHRLSAVGHRVVHGGEEFSAPVRVTAQVLATLERFVPLAPLHQPHNLQPIRLLLKNSPEVVQVACFDTAFHRTISAVGQAYALPTEITARGVRRYGFHGLSYEYIASVLAQYDRRAAEGRTVVLHLGNGASMCAMKAGKSVGTSMGFTALGGLPMGTRCGDLDPGVLLFLMDELKMDARAIENLLYKGPACWAFRASPATCARCSRPRIRRRSSRWSCSSMPSGASWAPWRRRWAGWMRWYSPLASASTRRRCASRCAGARPGSASSWTPRPTPPTGPASAPPPAVSRPG